MITIRIHINSQEQNIYLHHLKYSIVIYFFFTFSELEYVQEAANPVYIENEPELDPCLHEPASYVSVIPI